MAVILKANRRLVKKKRQTPLVKKKKREEKMTREDWLGSYRSGVKLIVRNDPIEDKVSAFREEAPKLASNFDLILWYDVVKA
jgi:uncharacterized protein YnzC (UPF0291/DUF896 family)